MPNDTSTAERWLPVPNYEGLYEVSDLGRVRSQRREGARGGVKTPTQNPRWKYPQVMLWRDGRNTLFKVANLVAAAFLGPRPDGMEVCHGDGDRLNSQLSNLRYGTRSDNVQDALRHGTHFMAAKTHCKRGHEFTQENTYTAPETGYRTCRACQRLMRGRP